MAEGKLTLRDHLELRRYYRHMQVHAREDEKDYYDKKANEQDEIIRQYREPQKEVRKNAMPDNITFVKRDFDPRQLRTGLYMAVSDTPGYAKLRALAMAGYIYQMGERVLSDGRKAILVKIGNTKFAANPKISWKFSPNFFDNMKREYGSDWKICWWREAIQNSVDAGATIILCEVKDNGDNTITATCMDNGSGMTEEELKNLLFSLGETGKRGKGTTGGFGKAKELLLLPHISYYIRTLDNEAQSAPEDNLEITVSKTKEMFKGTYIRVIMNKDRAVNTSDAIAYIQRCRLPSVKFLVKGYDNYEDAVTEKEVAADFDPGRRIDMEVHARNLVDFCDITSRKIKLSDRDQSARLYVMTSDGQHMFSKYAGNCDAKVTVKLKVKSIDVLMPNRLDFTNVTLREGIGEFLEKLARDKFVILQEKSKKIKEIWSDPRSDNINFDTRSAELVNLLTETEFIKKRKVRIIPPKILGAIAAQAYGHFAERKDDNLLANVSYDIAKVLLDIEFVGQGHIESALKLLTWKPEFLILNNKGDTKIPIGLHLENMKPNTLRLAKFWTELVRFILIQMNCDKTTFNTGFVLDSELAGLQIKDNNWILFNPMRGDEIFWPTDRQDLERIYEVAVHECTHYVTDYGDCGRAFESALGDYHSRMAANFYKLTNLITAVGMHGMTEFLENGLQKLRKETIKIE